MTTATGPSAETEGRPVQQRGANLSKEEDIILTKAEGTKGGMAERERARVVGFWFCPPDPIFYRRRGKQAAVVTAEKRLMD